MNFLFLWQDHFQHIESGLVLWISFYISTTKHYRTNEWYIWLFLKNVWLYMFFHSLTMFFTNYFQYPLYSPCSPISHLIFAFLLFIYFYIVFFVLLHTELSNKNRTYEKGWRGGLLPCLLLVVSPARHSNINILWLQLLAIHIGDGALHILYLLPHWTI